MIIDLRSLREASVRKTKAVLRYGLLFLSISLVSPLMACTPRSRSTEPASSTPTAQSTTTLAMLTATSMTFIAEADAQVSEPDPHLNGGDSIELMVDGEEDPQVESFIRFAVTGITGPVHSAHLRVYVTANASEDGPAVYATGASWSESTMTWSSRPARVGGPLDDQDSINPETWVEYDVTLFVADNKTYSFVLTADSDDAITFSSREGSQPPQLVILLADGPTATAGIPVTGATSYPDSPYTPEPTASLTFTADMDARVRESNPDKNYGTSSSLQADNASDPGVESFLRFTVTGITGQVLSAWLNIYVTTNGSRNGPAIYSTEPSWTELGITWNTRPARTSREIDNKDRIRANRWVDYEVTPLVKGNGKYSFVLVADGDDAVNFSSREGVHPPQLVIIFIHGAPALTPYE